MGSTEQFSTDLHLLPPFFAQSPMSALALVIKSRSSASLHAPLSFMSFVNGALWVAYGLVGAADDLMRHTWSWLVIQALCSQLMMSWLATFPPVQAILLICCLWLMTLCGNEQTRFTYGQQRANTQCGWTCDKPTQCFWWMCFNSACDPCT